MLGGQWPSADWRAILTVKRYTATNTVIRVVHRTPCTFVFDQKLVPPPFPLFFRFHSGGQMGTNCLKPERNRLCFTAGRFVFSPTSPFPRSFSSQPGSAGTRDMPWQRARAFAFKVSRERPGPAGSSVCSLLQVPDAATQVKALPPAKVAAR